MVKLDEVETRLYHVTDRCDDLMMIIETSPDASKRLDAFDIEKAEVTPPEA
jgi:hypothetical protein